MSTQSMPPSSWDQRYQTGDLPWDTGVPAPELIAALGELKLAGKSALEIGCGTGTNAIWLASQGFSVTATDLAPTAIEIARKKAQAAGAQRVTFRCSDIAAEAPAAAGSVDFAFDRGVFHSVPPDVRPVFVQRVAEALKRGGYWLTLTGNADQVRSPGELGPPQLKASEIVNQVETRFEIHRLDRFLFTKEGQPPHLAWRCLMRKR